MDVLVETGRKVNLRKTFRRRLGRLLNVLCTFNLRPVSTVVLRQYFTHVLFYVLIQEFNESESLWSYLKRKGITLSRTAIVFLKLCFILMTRKRKFEIYSNLMLLNSCILGIFYTRAFFLEKHLQKLFFSSFSGLRPATSLKKKILAQVFSYEFCKISKNTFSYGSPPVAASVIALNDVSGVFYKDEASQVMPARENSAVAG